MPAYLWDEIDARARRLLDEVHALARTYCWSEEQILALSETRRRAYLRAGAGLSGLLQRLAGQALGANAKGTSGNAPRIRPAATVQAQMPLAVATEIEAAPAATLEAPRLNEARNTHSQATHPRTARIARRARSPIAASHQTRNTPRRNATSRGGPARRQPRRSRSRPCARPRIVRLPRLLSEMPETTAVASSAAIMPLLRLASRRRRRPARPRSQPRSTYTLAASR